MGHGTGSSDSDEGQDCDWYEERTEGACVRGDAGEPMDRSTINADEEDSDVEMEDGSSSWNMENERMAPSNNRNENRKVSFCSTQLQKLTHQLGIQHRLVVALRTRLNHW